MAKVAAAAQTSTIPFGGGGGSKATTTTTTMKRKTPSELRGELLKRKNVIELVDESLFPATASTRDGEGNVPVQKNDLPKNPKYIDTRMDELFPVRKNSIRLRLLSKQEHSKDNAPVEVSGRLKASSAPMNMADESRAKTSCKEDSVTSVAFCEDRATKTCNTAEKCGESTFRNVAELSLGGDSLSGLLNVDMDKALKGLVANDRLTASASLAKSSELKLQSSFSDFIISGDKTPLDLTLKTTMRVVSSTSVNWFHRSVNCGTFCSKFESGSQDGKSVGQDMAAGSTELGSLTPRCDAGGLSSWVFPQSSLPPSVISALTSAAVGGQVDFLTNRQKAWEDSFRSLYYLLRKNICNIFYVCTAQFVVMFTACDGPKETKRSCNAYISQSTRGLRSLLKEHDVCFSMPLCHSKMDEVSAEDLIELSVFENHNLEGQHFVAMSDVNNGPQSLLMFTGNQSVHGLYDFLLNYRFFFLSLTGVDVPILYSPVPFENAALSAPQVRCKEVRRADQMHLPLKNCNATDESTRDSAAGIHYSVEVKDAYLPPWIISCICNAMGSDGTSFEASFVTEPTSIGLNVGLDTIGQDSHPQATTYEALPKDTWNFGIQNTSFSPHLRSAFLKGLKYNSGSYTASLSRV